MLTFLKKCNKHIQSITCVNFDSPNKKDMSNKHDTYSIQHSDAPEANLRKSVQSVFFVMLKFGCYVEQHVSTCEHKDTRDEENTF